jgi:hypothetical protein
MAGIQLSTIMNHIMVDNWIPAIPASTTNSLLVQTILNSFICELISYYNIISIKYRSQNRELTKGMVVTTIFAYFINNIVNSSLFTFKFWI